MTNSKEERRNAAMGKIVALLRVQRGLTQEDLGALSGVAGRTIQRIEAGQGAEPDTWETIAREFARGGRASDWKHAFDEDAHAQTKPAPAKILKSRLPDEPDFIPVFGMRFRIFTDDAEVLVAGEPFNLVEQHQKDITFVLHQNHMVRSDSGEEYPLKFKGHWIPLRQGARLTIAHCRSDGGQFPMGLLNHHQAQAGWTPIPPPPSPIYFMTKGEKWRNLAVLLASAAASIAIVVLFHTVTLWTLAPGLAFSFFSIGRAEMRRLFLRRRVEKFVQKVNFIPARHQADDVSVVEASTARNLSSVSG